MEMRSGDLGRHRHRNQRELQPERSALAQRRLAPEIVTNTAETTRFIRTRRFVAFAS